MTSLVGTNRIVFRWNGSSGYIVDNWINIICYALSRIEFFVLECVRFHGNLNTVGSYTNHNIQPIAAITANDSFFFTRVRRYFCVNCNYNGSHLDQLQNVFGDGSFRSIDQSINSATDAVNIVICTRTQCIIEIAGNRNIFRQSQANIYHVVSG